MLSKDYIFPGADGELKFTCSHLCGDATSSSSYEKIFENGKASMLLADPPYCLLTRRRKSGALRDPKASKVNHEAVSRFESVREYREFTKRWLSEAVKWVEEEGVLAIWTNFLGREPILKVATELGYGLRGEFTWAKYTKEKPAGNEVLARVYEVALILSRHELSSDLDERELTWSVIGGYDEEGEAGLWGDHPNHKPFSLLRPLIKNFTRRGEIILDPFSGSGSTPAAVIKLGRQVRGIELRSDWAAITQKRMAMTVKDLSSSQEGLGEVSHLHNDV